MPDIFTSVILPSITSTHFLRTLGMPFQFNEPSDATDEGDSSCEAADDPFRTGITAISPSGVALDAVEHTDAFLFPSILSLKPPELEADDPLPSPL